MARRVVAEGEVEELRGRIQQWRLTRTKQGQMPEELWRAAVGHRGATACPLSRALGVGYAGLKTWTLAASQPSRQAPKAAKTAGFFEVSAAHLLAPGPGSRLVIEYMVREGSRLTLTGFTMGGAEAHAPS